MLWVKEKRMEKIPAFPVSAELCQDLTIEQQRGMTLRDYFAAHAMQAILSTTAQGIRPTDIGFMADDVYKIADAMMKAREA
jgi:hypothetical protein